jgi:hypothetical protein
MLFAACLAVVAPQAAAARAAAAMADAVADDAVTNDTATKASDNAGANAAANRETAAAQPAAPQSPPASRVAVPITSALEESLHDYSRYTHHQLTQLGARWDELDDVERRALLQEVKLRMARQKGSKQVLQIRTQRRYGRLVRRSDGKVLRIETQVVRVAPVTVRPETPERSFGVGFERRSAATTSPQADEAHDQSPVPRPDAQGALPTQRASSETP